MNTPVAKPRNMASHLQASELKTLFLATAYDLKVSQNKDVIDAAADLAACRFHTFVRKLDSWGSQLYNSTEEESFRLSQLAALFSKYPFVDPDIDRENVAIEKFKRSERKCARMNKKFVLRSTRLEPPHMQYMRDFIESVIGREPNITSILDKCDFGPGSSVGVHGAKTSVKQKLGHLSVTPAAEPVARAALYRNHHYMQVLTDSVSNGLVGDFPDDMLEVHRVQYNKIVCVPKNAKTDRTIAIEPTLNGYIQKGIDLELRSKLIRVGIDLSRQSLNQALACFGSQGRGYATIDLSAASDSISIMLVKSLLPPSWFTLLNSSRSPMYLLQGEVHRYEKFCSMGNGFCFPLETLIFLAACEYAMSQTHMHYAKTRTVYGDDIIVPQECALLLLEVLSDLGFKANNDKTFIFGPFRESCGADFLNGVNVRPIYIKDPIYLDHRCYSLLNLLQKKRFNSAWNFLYQKLPKHKRFLRPYHREDDSAITVPLDVFMASKWAVWNRSTFSWNWRGLIVKSDSAGKPDNESQLLMGKLRGDLIHSATFTARFSERTRTEVMT